MPQIHFMKKILILSLAISSFITGKAQDGTVSSLKKEAEKTIKNVKTLGEKKQF